jgi:hypothetical protein
MTWSTNNKQHTTTTMFGGNSAHVSTGEEKQNTTTSTIEAASSNLATGDKQKDLQHHSLSALMIVLLFILPFQQHLIISW